jgi:hypothetical protein
MRRATTLLLLLLVFGCNSRKIKDYRVQEKDSANFSVFISMLYPKEKIVVKINGEAILDQTGDEKNGGPQSYLYYNYPDKILKIAVSGSHNGYATFEQLFLDTLVNVQQKTLIISYPFPKGMSRKGYKPSEPVPLKNAYRHITLVDDAVQYKDEWRY